MSGLEEIKDEVHSLGKEIAGLRPLVYEMHNNLPRIVAALETLAKVTVRLEANAEDHKRLHFRITDTEEGMKALRIDHADLNHRFEVLKEEHIVCTTTQSLLRKAERTGLWTKIKAKITDKAIELMIIAILGFIGWMVLTHLSDYQKSAPLAEIDIYQGGVS